MSRVFSERLKKLRSLKGLSQQELADRLKLNRATYARYETDSGTEPDFATLELLADFYDVSTDYLLGRSNVVGSTSSSKIQSTPTQDFMDGLSPENQEDFKKIMELFRIKSMQDRNKNSVMSDELTNGGQK